MAKLLRKRSIIHLESEVTKLLNQGATRFQYPIKLVYLLDDVNIGISDTYEKFKVMFIVPKRYIKKSSQRNLVKRRMREAFRIHQDLVECYVNQNSKTIYLAFIYVSKEVLPYKQIETAVIQTITHL